MLSIREWERRCQESAARSYQRRDHGQRHEALLILAVAIGIWLLISGILVMYT